MPRPVPQPGEPSDGVRPVALRTLDAPYLLRGVCVIAARGDLDIDSLAPLRDALEAASAAHSTVVLDATDITFGDSSFLNLLLRMDRATSFRIAAPSAQIERLLLITGADQVLSLYPGVDSAVDGAGEG